MDLVGYLETLPKDALSRLYSSPWTSQAVLRGLPPLGKLYTLRMLFLEVSKPLNEDLHKDTWLLSLELASIEGIVKKDLANNSRLLLSLLLPTHEESASRFDPIGNLLLQQPLPNTVLESWPKPEGIPKHRVAIQKLKRLQILQEGPKRLAAPLPYNIIV